MATAVLTLLMLLLTSSKFIGVGTWYLQARPQIKYTTSGGNPTITCYNISTTSKQSYSAQWYKIAPNGTLEQLSTDTNYRVRSDGSQLRISSAINEDNGTYCCKGPTQAVVACDESATASLIVVIPPVIVARQNQTVFVGKNVTIECTIENVGTPPFVVYRWQKFKQRLMTDGKKYISQLLQNKMFLTILNSTIDDESYYQCILETPVFQRRQASVYLSVYDTRITHAGSINDITYSLQLHGPGEISVGMNLIIQCTVMESSRSVEISDIQLSLIMPTGEVVIGNKFNTVATLEYSGTYSCIALVNGTTMMVSLQLIVYAAPQPSFHNATVSTPYGSSINLPCPIDIANPLPLYNWTHLPANDPSSEKDKILSDGSLQLKNVQRSGIYQCTAWNDYGSSLQIVKLNVEMTTTTTTTARNQSLKLVGKHLQSSCHQLEHAVELSALLQEYITSICSCGHITVNVTITSCTDPTATYSVQFTGVMATEAVLSLITKMEGLTEGLYLTIVTLYLEEQTNCSNDQNKADQTGVLSYIATLSTIIVVVILMMVLLIMSIIMTKKPSKNDAKQLSQYEQMQHHEALTTASQRSTSNYFLSHYEVKYLQHQNSRIV